MTKEAYDETQKGMLAMIWEDFSAKPPVENGYYLIRYRHKDGKMYRKAVWWNGKEFAYMDYVKEVLEYIPDRYDYYVPCMLQDHSEEK